MRFTKNKAIAAIVAMGAAAIPAVSLVVAVAFHPVDRNGFIAAYRPSSRIYDRSGVLLRETVNEAGERAFFVPLGDMSPMLVDAVLSAEDSAFRWHFGVDPLAITRAFAANRFAGKTVSGASTLTMQLARIVYEQPRTVGGKLSQAFDALRLEAAFSKDEILEAYLNRVSFAPGSLGAEAASTRYFRKSCAQLGAAEAALLAGLIQAPTRFDPFVNPEETLRRRNWVLDRMLRTRRLSREEYAAARSEPLPEPRPSHSIKAGHFTDYVLSFSPSSGDIHTTLDWFLQESVEALVAAHVRRYAANGLTNSAVVVLDNSNLEILAMVGSRDWSAGDEGNVNGVVALRQPGSALKPFAYALAFENGYSPTSMLADIETEYVNNDRALYIPRNYSRSYRGPVIAKEALATSLNIPAIRLIRDVGVGKFLSLLQRLGFTSLDRDADYYGLGLVLGNGEVSLLQMATAYTVLARNGLYRDCSPYIGTREDHRVISEAAAWLVTSILSDETMRQQAFGTDSPLQVGFPMAIKTGTSSNWRDSWTVGFTAEFTVAVWSGDFGSTPMNQLTGSTGAGPLFNAVARLMASRNIRMPTLPVSPESVRKVIVCGESGGTPSSCCPRRLVAFIGSETNPALCTVHSLAHIDVRSGSPASSDTPPEYVRKRLAYELPAEYALWLKESGKFVVPRSSAPSKGMREELTVQKPREGDVYIIEPGYDLDHQTLELTATSLNKVPAVDWYVDGVLVSTATWPYVSSWKLSVGTHVVSAKCGDAHSRPVRFSVK